MNLRTQMQEAKLRNILDPDRSAKEFKITIRFRNHSSSDIQEALALARKNEFYFEEGVGKFRKIYASFYPENVADLFKIFELVKNQETTKLYLNNKQIPYIQDLWLFLMWFHQVK